MTKRTRNKLLLLISKVNKADSKLYAASCDLKDAYEELDEFLDEVVEKIPIAVLRDSCKLINSAETLVDSCSENELPSTVNLQKLIRLVKVKP